MIGPFFSEWQAGECPEGVTCWGVKTVSPDFTTRGGFRWPFPGGWAQSDERIDERNGGPCPSHEGDGLSVGLCFAGMAQGGMPARMILIVGWRPGDVLGWDGEKARVRQAFVAAVVDGEATVRRHGTGANLYGANLRGANLCGADLCGADLCGAFANEATGWPAGFDTREAAVVFGEGGP